MGAHSVQVTDLSDNATFALGFPHEHFSWAREHAPVYWHEPTAVTPDGEGFWVMSRHEDAMAIMLDPETFSSDKGGGRTAGGTGLHDEYQAGKFLNWADDPHHKRLRRLAPEEDGSAGGPLTDEELLNFFMLLFAAGAETTRSAIGGGLRALMERPEQLEQLRKAGITEMRTAVDEILRWTTPSIYKRRTATHDVSFKGHRIKAGDKVTYWEMSANRDAAVFEDPFRFDIARSPNRHVAFGFGAHVSLARMEMRLAFAELLARIETFTPEGPIEWMPNNRLLGIRHMPLSIRFRGERRTA